MRVKDDVAVADVSARDREGVGNRRRTRRAVLAVLALLTVLTVIAVVAFKMLTAQYLAKVERFGDPLSSIPESSRAAPKQAGGPAPTTVLIVGSDSRISAGDPARWEEGAQRTDAIMLAHLAGDRTSAHVVSIPRDTWVPIPGHGTAKINAAFSFGGPALLIQTVEALTDVRVDHLAIVDFEGFQHITDSLGGVDIRRADGSWDRMSGAEALAYVRERKSLPNGDFDRARRQQNWVRGVAHQVIRQENLRHPLALRRFLDDATAAVAVDDSFTPERMRGFLGSMSDLTVSDIKFLTVPVEGTARSDDGQSIVVLDDDAAAGLWRAMRTDGLAEWVTNNPGSVTPNRVP